MKTDLTQIAEVYRACVEEKKPEQGAGCPSPEDLVRLVTDRVRRKERARLMDHVAGCGECAPLLKSLLRLSEEVDRLTGKAEPSQGPKPLLSRRAALWALAGLIGLTVVTYSVIRLAERPVVRGTSGIQVRLISPKQGASLAAGDIELKWEAVPKASRYTVELFNRSLEKVWRSGPITDAQLKLPEDARRVILGGETYFWRITAVLEDGQEVLSKLAEFSIRK